MIAAALPGYLQQRRPDHLHHVLSYSRQGSTLSLFKCSPSVPHCPDLEVLHNEVLLRRERRITEGGTGKAGTMI